MRRNGFDHGASKNARGPEGAHPECGRGCLTATSLLRTHNGHRRVHVRSAGSAPVNAINPMVIEAMKEIGLDLGAEYPKPLTDDVLAAADVVVSIGCGDPCAIYPGKRYLRPDPRRSAGSNSRDGPRHPRRPGHQGPTLLRESTTPVPA